jgi:hypothetical protein
MIKILPFIIALASCSCGGLSSGSFPAKTPAGAGTAISLEYLHTITLAGMETAPVGLSAGIDSTLYLCWTEPARIARIDHSGAILSSFNGIDSRTGSVFRPVDLSVAGGVEVYVLDSGSSRILRLDRNLKNALTVYAAPSGRERMFGSFRGLAFERTTGDLYVSDRDTGSIKRIDMLGGNIQTSGGFGSEQTSLIDPAGIDCSTDGAIYVADAGTGAIAVQNHFGAAIRFIGRGRLGTPVDVAVLNNGYMAAACRDRVVVLDINGTIIASTESINSLLLEPQAVAFFDNTLYVSDRHSHSIVVFAVR